MSDLTTFRLPAAVTPSDAGLGREMVGAWRSDGIFRIAVDALQAQKIVTALTASRRFFSMPLAYKARHVSDLSYSGYLASREEIAAGEADYSEVFTVCRDVPYGDARVREGWPCHGPVPWPDLEYRLAMRAFMAEAGGVGDRVLRLVALGLGWPADALTRLTRDGWHHMRVLRFPSREAGAARGIGAHTDYGLLVMVAQSEQVGGLFVRPPPAGEDRARSWLERESTAGMFENEEPWNHVPPVPDVLTVFPGDVMQFLTDGLLLSTPHKLALAERERYTLAYFHEPGFEASVAPYGPEGGGPGGALHYGTHFTTMFMRSHPERAATRRILDEGRLEVLNRIRADHAWCTGAPARDAATAQGPGTPPSWSATR